jgi:hypothetical protein
MSSNIRDQSKLRGVEERMVAYEKSEIQFEYLEDGPRSHASRYELWFNLWFSAESFTYQVY